MVCLKKEIPATLIFQMKLLSFAGAALISGLMTAGSPARAGTYVITDGWLQDGSDKKCVDMARKVANMAGFPVSQEVVKSEKSLDFYAYAENGPYALAVTCREDAGVTSVAISGINLEKTWEIWKKLMSSWTAIDQ